MDDRDERFEVGRLLTVSEVAAALRVSTMTIYRLVHAGDLPAIRVGSHYRIQERELMAYLAERASDPADDGGS